MHFGTRRMNASTFGIKRSKFKVTVWSNMLESALFDLVNGYNTLQVAGLNFMKLLVSAVS